MHVRKEVRRDWKNPRYRSDKRHTTRNRSKGDHRSIEPPEPVLRGPYPLRGHICGEHDRLSHQRMGRNDFRKTNGTPIANAEGWQKLWKKMQGHLIRMEKGRHAYSDEIRKIMEDT